MKMTSVLNEPTIEAQVQKEEINLPSLSQIQKQKKPFKTIFYRRFEEGEEGKRSKLSIFDKRPTFNEGLKNKRIPNSTNKSMTLDLSKVNKDNLLARENKTSQASLSAMKVYHKNETSAFLNPMTETQNGRITSRAHKIKRIAIQQSQRFLNFNQAQEDAKDFESAQQKRHGSFSPNNYIGLIDLYRPDSTYRNIENYIKRNVVGQSENYRDYIILKNKLNLTKEEKENKDKRKKRNKNKKTLSRMTSSQSSFMKSPT